MKNKTVVITGATSGIGKETAIGLALLGVNIVFPARDIEKAKRVKQEIIDISGNSNVDYYRCDLASFTSIRAFSKQIHASYSKIDILINNAGIYVPKFQQSEDCIELTFAVNHLAHFLLTHLLMDLIWKSPEARIINVSSAGHKKGKIHFNDVELMRYYSGLKAYRQSKLANVLFTHALAEMLSGTHITVNSLHPGIIRTSITRRMSSWMQKVFNLVAQPLHNGADTPIYLACSPDVKEISGAYFEKMKICKPSFRSLNRETAQKLWDLSEELCEIERFLPINRVANFS